MKKIKENIKTNKKSARKNYSNQTGITLIALVVTIVVLLILAGVSINAVFGQDGIIQKAKDSQNKMDEAQQKDLNSINELNNWLDSKINGNAGGGDTPTVPVKPTADTAPYYPDTTFTKLEGTDLSNGLVIKDFIDSLKQAARDNEQQMMKARAEDERNKIKAKLSKLVDLYVEGKVDQTTFEMKQNDLKEKAERIEEKLISLNNMIAEDDKVEIGIKKIQTELQIRESSNEIKDFDEDLFEALVDYGIIGGYDEKGNKQNYMIRFICKKGFSLRPREDISPSMIVENNQLDQEGSIYNPIIDFVSNQNFFVYDDTGERRRKTLISKVRVRVEIEQ